MTVTLKDMANAVRVLAADTFLLTAVPDKC